MTSDKAQVEGDSSAVVTPDKPVVEEIGLTDSSSIEHTQSMRDAQGSSGASTDPEKISSLIDRLKREGAQGLNLSYASEIGGLDKKDTGSALPEKQSPDSSSDKRGADKGEGVRSGKDLDDRGGGAKSDVAGAPVDEGIEKSTKLGHSKVEGAVWKSPNQDQPQVQDAVWRSDSAVAKVGPEQQVQDAMWRSDRAAAKVGPEQQVQDAMWRSDSAAAKVGPEEQVQDTVWRSDSAAAKGQPEQQVQDAMWRSDSAAAKAGPEQQVQDAVWRSDSAAAKVGPEQQVQDAMWRSDSVAAKIGQEQQVQDAVWRSDSAVAKVGPEQQVQDAVWRSDSAAAKVGSEQQVQDAVWRSDSIQAKAGQQQVQDTVWREQQGDHAQPKDALWRSTDENPRLHDALVPNEKLGQLKEEGTGWKTALGKQNVQELLDNSERNRVQPFAKDTVWRDGDPAPQVQETVWRSQDAEQPVVRDTVWRSAEQQDAPAENMIRQARLGENTGIPNDSGSKIAAEDFAKRSDLSSDAGANERKLRDPKVGATVDAIDQTIKNGADPKFLQKLLDGKTPQELKDISDLYREKFGQGKDLRVILADKLSGSDLASVKASLNGHNDDASHIHTQILKHRENSGDRNASQNIIDMFKGRSSADIEKLGEQYKERYGVSLKDALKDSAIPDSTKQALDVYMKGADKREFADVKRLADLATSSKDLDMFKSVFSDGAVTKEMRKQYFDNGGEKSIAKAFGPWVYGQTLEQRQALDYARTGKLGVDTAIDLNRSIIGDNEKAIEHALKGMTQEERDSYLAGKKLAAGDTSNLTDQQKKDLDYHNKVHDALSKAAGYNLGIGSDNARARELARWEDMIAVKGGSMLSKLTDHFGTVYNDSVGKALETIEKADKTDLERLKTDPSYRKQIDDLIARHYTNKEDQARFKDLLDRKVNSKNPDDEKIPLVDRLKDKTGTFYTDTKDVLSSFEKMSKSEQDRYRTDSEYRKQVDDAVKQASWSPAVHAAVKEILADVIEGKEPKVGIMSKLHAHSRDFVGDTGKVIADVEGAFKADPSLRERLSTDRKFAEEFAGTLRSALGADAFEKYGTKLMEKGELSIEDKAQIHQKTNQDRLIDKALLGSSILAPVLSPVLLGVLATKSEGDKQGFFDSLKTASPEELAKISQHSDRLLGFLTEQERAVAKSIASQDGKIQPEDQLRIAFLTGDKEKANQVIQNLTPQDAAKLRDSYASKYGRDALSDVKDNLGGEDQRAAIKALREPAKDSAEALRRAQDDRPNDSIGRWLVDKAWDGTGIQSDDAYHQLSRQIGAAAKENKTLNPEQLKELGDRMDEALKLYRESKTAAADAVVDGTLLIVGVGGSVFTGGVSLSLLTATGIAGAGFKIAAKSAIEGKDYDWSLSNVIKDGSTGAFQSATSFFGGAQLAILSKVGESTAITATKTVLSQAEKLAADTGASLLKKGSEEALSKGLMNRLAVAIANGEREISEKSLKVLTKELASNAESVPGLEKLIKTSLDSALKTETGSILKSLGRETLLQSQATGLGGTATGFVEGLNSIDPNKSFLDNVANIAQKMAEQTVFNAGIAGLATPGMKVITKGLTEIGNTAGDLIDGGKKLFKGEVSGLDAPSVRAGMLPDSAHPRSVETQKKELISAFFQKEKSAKLQLDGDGHPVGWPSHLKGAIDSIDDMPPVQPGYKRLYRGIQMEEGAQKEFLPPATHAESKRWGELAEIASDKRSVEEVKEMIALFPRISHAQQIKFYSDSFDMAQQWAGKKGVVSYLDVKIEDSHSMHVGNHGLAAAGFAGDTYQVPAELHLRGARLIGNERTASKLDNVRLRENQGGLSKEAVELEKKKVIEEWVERNKGRLELNGKGLPADWPNHLMVPEKMPDLAEGHVRLYRGIQIGKGADREFAESATSSQRNQWYDLSLKDKGEKTLDEVKEQIRLADLVRNPDAKYYTDDLGTAMHFAKTNPAYVISYVDVAAEELMNWSVPNAGLAAAGLAGGTYTVPIDIHRSKAKLVPGKGVIPQA